ncbi:hypothetical protein KUTeg_000434 [Tegillarca granosa]|uniref:Uncharacterized protein n=1 Tax=Tegillarca granosa TaxID=220873 RepID=A0ABQ9FXJ8_TEGGR|nr:hypothetical protein KUTeg_000434 [Tegillarca granosa]
MSQVQKYIFIIPGIIEMAANGIEQGIGPDYRIHTYDIIREPPVYRQYNSNYTYNHTHSYNHVHSYDKIHEYNKIKTYDHVHEWKYREYKTKFISKTERKTKSQRQWEFVPTEVEYYKDIGPELYLCYKMPMGPDIRVTDYTYREYTPSNFRPRYFGFEDINTNCAKYMDKPYVEYKGSVEYKLTKSNYHPFTRYTHQEKRHRTVMKKQYKDENQNIIDKRGNMDKYTVVAVVIPTGQTQEKQTLLTPHNTPSPSPTITPVEVSSVVIDSPVPTQRDEKHNIIPVVGVVPLNKQQIDNDSISDIQEESEVDIDEIEESDTEDKIDTDQEEPKNNDQENEQEGDSENDVNPAPVVVAAAIVSEPDVDTKEAATEKDNSVKGETSQSEDFQNKSSLPPEVVAAIEAYDVAHSELKVPDPYSATGTISRTIGMIK